MSNYPVFPEWQWNEFQQIGTDYADTVEVAQYEARMLQFRDIEAENRFALDRLALPHQAKLLEIGCGTALFSRTAAPSCTKVTAVDISPVMLAYAAEAAEKNGLSNISFIQSGFLSLELESESFDGVMTSLALHHLPDFWKQMALDKIADALKPDGKFFLFDIVFDPVSTSIPDYIQNTILPHAPTASRESFRRHIAQEYSTFDWIMRGLIERSGLTFVETGFRPPYLRWYFCQK